MQYTVHAINGSERETFVTGIKSLAFKVKGLWEKNPNLTLVGIQWETK